MAGAGEHAYYNQRISRLKRGLIWDFFGCLVGWALLGWRIIFQLDWVQIWTFIFPYIGSTVVLLVLQMPNKILPYASAHIFRKWSRLRKYFNMKIKVEDGHRIEDFANTGKTWATYLTECNVDRVEHSIQCVGIAVLSTYFNLSTKTNICTLDDLATILIILWCAIMTSSAAWSYERRYHQYLRTLHTQSSCYPVISCDSMEGILIFGCHLFRVVWTLHFMNVLLLFRPWMVLVFWAVSILWNVGTHYIVDRFGNTRFPELVRCHNFKKILYPADAQFSRFARYPTVKNALYPEHFIFTSSVTLPCSSTGTVGPWTKWYIVLKDLLPMLVGQTLLSWSAPHASHDLVRESNYHCRIEHAQPVDIKLAIFEAKSDGQLEWKVIVPQYFFPLEPIGIGLLLFYMLFLALHCFHAQKRKKRSVNFPAEVATRLYHRVVQSFPTADREVQFARLMLLLLTESGNEFRRMLAKAKLVPIVMMTERSSLEIRKYKDEADIKQKYDDLIGGGLRLTTVKVNEMESFRSTLQSLRGMSKESGISSRFPRVFKKLYQSLEIRGQALFSNRLLIMLNILDVNIEEALGEIRCQSEGSRVQNCRNPGVGMTTGTADGPTATVQIRIDEATAKSKKKRGKSSQERNLRMRTTSSGNAYVTGGTIEVSNRYAQLMDEDPGDGHSLIDWTSEPNQR